MKLAPKKCKFRFDQVSHVCHQFTNGGFKPDETKVAAIKEMPTPDTASISWHDQLSPQVHQQFQ